MVKGFYGYTSIRTVKQWDRVMFSIESEDVAVYCNVKCRF